MKKCGKGEKTVKKSGYNRKKEYKEFSSILRKVRRYTFRKTQREMADFLGVPATTYGQWEREISLPNIEHLNKLLEKTHDRDKTYLVLFAAHAAAKED